jgi:hypothetical protein
MPHKRRTANIKSIEIWEDNPQKDRTSHIVRINFKFPCMWTTLTIFELKELLEQWILAEERRYPQSKGFKGRELLQAEINKVFREVKIQ